MAATLLQVLQWASQGWHGIVLMRLRWIPAESRKLWLWAITCDGTPEVRFWHWMLYHGKDIAPSARGGHTTFRAAGPGCSSLKHPQKTSWKRTQQKWSRLSLVTGQWWSCHLRLSRKQTLLCSPVSRRTCPNHSAALVAVSHDRQFNI